MRPDIEKARQAMLDRSGARKCFRKLPEYLDADETVRRLATGTLRDRGVEFGLVVLTDCRVLVLGQRWFGMRSESVSLDKITSVGWDDRAGIGRLTISTAGHDLDVASITARDGRALVNDLRAST